VTWNLQLSILDRQMRKAPLILVSPSIERKGEEFADISISLSRAYQEAVIGAGGLPLAMPATLSQPMIAQCVARCDGVMLTGGEDVEPRFYPNGLPAWLRRKVKVTPDGGERSLRELMVIDEVFRQRKPLLAICRGHQLVNVALGGTLVADIPSQCPGAINHRRMDRRNAVVHQVKLTEASLLAKITGRRMLGVNSTHHQAVARVAQPLQVTAVSPDGVVEGTELGAGAKNWLPFFLSVQFHPERLANRLPEHQAIFRAFTRACLQDRRNNL
jgi:putative glutamine amidotransferase